VGKTAAQILAGMASGAGRLVGADNRLFGALVS
jgi:hypothetical protein